MSFLFFGNLRSIIPLNYNDCLATPLLGAVPTVKMKMMQIYEYCFREKQHVFNKNVLLPEYSADELENLPLGGINSHVLNRSIAATYSRISSG